MDEYANYLIKFVPNWNSARLYHTFFHEVFIYLHEYVNLLQITTNVIEIDR